MSLHINKSELCCFAFASMDNRKITKLLDLRISHDESDVQDERGDLSMKVIQPERFIMFYIPPHLLDTNLISLRYL